MAGRDVPKTFKEARNKDYDVIKQLDHITATEQLYRDLWDHRKSILSVVRAQLGLEEGAKCKIYGQNEWLRGSFNVCIPIHVKSRGYDKRFIFRCPMPFKLAESNYPGTVDEKQRSEIGAYAWFQEYCPDIRIPKLYGFSLANRHFTHESRLPWYSRLKRIVMRYFRQYFKYPFLSRYGAISIAVQLPTQYMLLEFIEPKEGVMLSASMHTHKDDPVRRTALFRGLARIMVSMSRIPLPRIGSFQFADDCTVTLTGRPLLLQAVISENLGSQRSIPVGETYTCTEPFVADAISILDNDFKGNRSAADDEDDCQGQMAVLATLRTLSHNYVKKDSRNGPFVLQLTDLHPSNILVDENWNNICLVDLEWVCSMPQESLSTPYWLGGYNMDYFLERSPDLTNYNILRQEFLRSITEEAENSNLALPLATIMEDSWQSNTVWFWHCLTTVGASYYLVNYCLCPQFGTTLVGIEQALWRLWRQDGQHIVQKKVAEFGEYAQELSKLYSE